MPVPLHRVHMIKTVLFLGVIVSKASQLINDEINTPIALHSPGSSSPLRPSPAQSRRAIGWLVEVLLVLLQPEIPCDGPLIIAAGQDSPTGILL